MQVSPHATHARSLHLHCLYFPHMHWRWCDGPPSRLPRHHGERQASQGRALLLLAARLLLGLGLLGSGRCGSVVLVVLLARHVVLAWLCGKLFAEEALAFIDSDVGSKGGDEVGERPETQRSSVLRRSGFFRSESRLKIGPSWSKKRRGPLEERSSRLC